MEIGDKYDIARNYVRNCASNNYISILFISTEITIRSSTTVTQKFYDPWSVHHAICFNFAGSNGRVQSRVALSCSSNALRNFYSLMEKTLRYWSSPWHVTFPLTAEPRLQSWVTSREILCGYHWSRFSSEFLLLFSSQSPFHRSSLTIYHTSLTCVIYVTRQHIVIFSVFKLIFIKINL